MSVDTKGCVVTDNKDVFEIIHKISENFPGSKLHMDSLFHTVRVFLTLTAKKECCVCRLTVTTTWETTQRLKEHLVFG